MSISVDLGNNALYVQDVLVGDTTPNSLTGTSVSSYMTAPSAAGGLAVLTGTSATSGGTGSTAAIFIGTGATSSLGIYFGNGAPSSLTAHQGSVYLNTTGATVSTRMYINTTGVSTWTAVTTVG